MEIVVKRLRAVDISIPGDLIVDGQSFCRCLERKGVQIPEGTYPIRLTVSHRVQEKSLWSPDPQDRLPLIENVPNRSGIRIHALNYPEQSDGCIGVGEMFGHGAGSVTLLDARPALTRLFTLLDAAEQRGEPSTIRIDDVV